MSEIASAHYIEVMVKIDEIASVLADDIILKTVIQVKAVCLYDVVTAEPIIRKSPRTEVATLTCPSHQAAL